MPTEWLSSKEAAQRLGVSAATLYAYVSRGLLRSGEPTGSASDATGLMMSPSSAAPRCRPQAESIAANALDFGTPVLESSLTLIENGRLFYRGQDAARLARNSSLEQVAQLLWDCDDRPFATGNLPPVSAALRSTWQAASALPPVDACLVLLPAAARWDHPSWVEIASCWRPARAS